MNVEQLSYRLKIIWLLKQPFLLQDYFDFATTEKHKTLLSDEDTRNQYHDS